MNIAILLNLSLAAFTMFLLVRYLTNNFYLSLIGGLLYGFSPIMMAYVLSEHYYYVFASVYLPLGIHYLLKYLDLRKKIDMYKIILVFWLCFFTNYYVAIMYIIILFILLISKLAFSLNGNKNLFFWFFDRKQLYTYSFVILIGCILPTVVLLNSVFNVKDFNQWQSGDNILHYQCGTNVVGFLTPSKASPHLASISNFITRVFNFTISTDTPSYFLGVSFLFLAVVSFVQLRKKDVVASFGLITIVFFLLSLGSLIKFGDINLLLGWPTLFYWFSRIPFLNLIDCPVRFSVAVQLFSVLLVILYLNEIVRIKNISSKKISLFIFLLFILEYGETNIPLTKVDIPEIYQMIAYSKDNYTVLEIPSGLSESKGSFGNDYFVSGINSKQMYWQTLYQRPRVGGYVSRIPLTTYHYFETEPVISNLFQMTSPRGFWSGKTYTKEEIKIFLSKFNIGYIVLGISSRQEYYKNIVETLLIGINYKKIELEGYILYKLK
jgi:hypothetical protein